MSIAGGMADLLIVDDDPGAGEMLAVVLRDRGHEVRVAHDGRQGYDMVDERLPDVVILDVEMPRLDGPGMSRLMLAEDVGKEKVPVLLVSGVEQLEQVAARVGTPYFLEKPFPLPELLSILERCLSEKRPPEPEPETET